MPICPKCRAGFDDAEICPSCGTDAPKIEAIPLTKGPRLRRRCSWFGLVCLWAGWLSAVVSVPIYLFNFISNVMNGETAFGILTDLLPLGGFLGTCYLFWMAILFAEGD